MTTDRTTIDEEALIALDLRPQCRVLSIGIPLPEVVSAIADRTGVHLSCVLIDDSDLNAAAATVRAIDAGEPMRLVLGSGYRGACAFDPRFDRILVTEGIAGVPPGWIPQLSLDGVIVAPIAHAGAHPLLSITRSPGSSDTLTGRVIRTGHARPASDSLLRPTTLFHTDAPWPVPDGGVLSGPSTGVVTDADQYENMRFCLGIADRSITAAVLDDPAFDTASGTCALVDSVALDIAWIHRDGRITVAGEQELGARLSSLVVDWNQKGRPAAAGWSTTLRRVETGGEGLLLPVEWQRPR